MMMKMMKMMITQHTDNNNKEQMIFWLEELGLNLDQRDVKSWLERFCQKE